MVPDAGAAKRRHDAAQARPGRAEARVVAGLSAGGGLGEVGGACGPPGVGHDVRCPAVVSTISAKTISAKWSESSAGRAALCDYAIVFFGTVLHIVIMNLSSPNASQSDLFETAEMEPEFQAETGGYEVSYDAIPVGRSTFRAGLSENVHSWFRLTPSFGPDLVRTIIKELGVPSRAHIHDPFSGAGTTAIEASLEGYEASCLEINPFLHFVGKTCLQWDISAERGRADLARIEELYSRSRETATLDNIEDLGVTIPPIHNIHRWWRSDVLKDMLVLKSSIRRQATPEFVSFFELALAAVLVPDLSNVTLGRLQLHFINKDNTLIDVWDTFHRHTVKMLDDLAALNNENTGTTGVIKHGDATVREDFEDFSDIDAVITSPPYPNRYSYVWNTRPHLYMLDMITVAKVAADIDRKTIGGTWGTATSELNKGTFAPINEIVEEALSGVHLRIAEQDHLMANYVVHYFNRLAKHLTALGPKLKPDAKLAYVVGNSWIKGEYVTTDVILAKIIEGMLPGFKIDKLHRFRHRHSGKKLYETIVYATRGAPANEMHRSQKSTALVGSS